MECAVESKKTTTPEVLDMQAILAEHPALARFFESFVDTFLRNGRLDARLRELAILRVAWRCAQPYEWAQHYRLARKLGVSDADVLGTRAGAAHPGFGEVERCLLAAVDEIVDAGRLSGAGFDRCTRALGGELALAVEFLDLVAGYRMMATILHTTAPPLADARLPLWPPDGIAPDPASAR
jgi:alkylhydroperoxidase family enzyme